MLPSKYVCLLHCCVLQVQLYTVCTQIQYVDELRSLCDLSCASFRLLGEDRTSIIAQRQRSRYEYASLSR